MSDNKTVQSAEAFTELNKTMPHQQAMIEFTRLHLEAMLKEITSGDEKVLLKRDVEKTGNNYISKIK